MAPILGRVGPILIYSYTAVLAVAVVLGMALAVRHLPGDATRRLDGLLVVTAAAVFGGRAGFVAANWDYFQAREALIWRLSEGGLTYVGALVAGLAAWALWLRWQKRPFLTTSDHLALSLLVVAAGGWLACYCEGCAYGQETTLGFFSRDLPDTFGIFAVRYQTQLLGLALTLAGFLLLPLWRRAKAGSRFWFALLWLNLSRLPVTWLRGDPVPLWDGWRSDLVLELIFSAIALIALLLLQYRQENNAVQMKMQSDK